MSLVKLLCELPSTSVRTHLCGEHRVQSVCILLQVCKMLVLQTGRWRMPHKSRNGGAGEARLQKSGYGGFSLLVECCGAASLFRPTCVASSCIANVIKASQHQCHVDTTMESIFHKYLRQRELQMSECHARVHDLHGNFGSMVFHSSL